MPGRECPTDLAAPKRRIASCLLSEASVYRCGPYGSHCPRRTSQLPCRRAAPHQASAPPARSPARQLHSLSDQHVRQHQSAAAPSRARSVACSSRTVLRPASSSTAPPAVTGRMAAAVAPVPAVPAPAAPASPPQQQQAAAATPSALWLVGARLREYATSTFEQRKPWSEVLDRSSFSKPGSIQEAASRLRKNAGYFRINYLIVILLTVAGTFLTHPSSLFVLAFLLASWVYMFAIKQGPLVINGKELSEREKLLAMSGISFIVVFFLTSVANVVFSALTLSFVIIGLHGATRVPDDLFLDEGESNQGLLAILTGSSSTTGANAV